MKAYHLRDYEYQLLFLKIEQYRTHIIMKIKILISTFPNKWFKNQIKVQEKTLPTKIFIVLYSLIYIFRLKNEIGFCN